MFNGKQDKNTDIYIFFFIKYQKMILCTLMCIYIVQKVVSPDTKHSLLSWVIS